MRLVSYETERGPHPGVRIGDRVHELPIGTDMATVFFGPFRVRALVWVR